MVNVLDRHHSSLLSALLSCIKKKVMVNVLEQRRHRKEKVSRECVGCTLLHTASMSVDSQSLSRKAQ